MSTVLHEIIIDYMIYKKQIIEKYIGTEYNYFTDDDANEIRHWELSDVLNILYRLMTESIDDLNMCPFCLYVDTECKDCLYKERHGSCMSPSKDNCSTYGSIINKLRGIDIDSITEIDEIDKYLKTLQTTVTQKLQKI